MAESVCLHPSSSKLPVTPPSKQTLTLTRQIVEGSYWIYAPNKGAPVFFAVAFAASGLWQIYQG